MIGAHADKGVLAGGGSSTVTDEGGDPVPGLERTGWPGPVRYHASAPLTFMQTFGSKVSSIRAPIPPPRQRPPRVPTSPSSS